MYIFVLLLPDVLTHLLQTSKDLASQCTRRNASPPTAPCLCPPPPTPLTPQTLPWVSCRPSPPRWPRAPSPTHTYTRSRPTPRRPLIPPPRSGGAREGMGPARATLPLTPAHSHRHHPPPRSTPLNRRCI